MRTLALSSLLLLASACTHVCAALPCKAVRFNEKERLADPQMAFDPDPLAAELKGHVLNPREASIGGTSGSASAGGCGCN